MSMVENRVRIVIEGDATLGVQSINQANSALDTLAARGRQAGGTAGAALDGVTSQAVALGTQGTASVGQVGGALALLGAKGREAGDAAGAGLSAVTTQAVELGRQGQAAVTQVGAALDAVVAKEQHANEATATATSRMVELGKQGQAAVGQVGTAMGTVAATQRQVGNAASSTSSKMVELGKQAQAVANTGAISSLREFRNALELSGATAKLTDSQLARLADRFRDKLAIDRAQEALDRARQQIERIGTAAGLSQQELDKLMRKLGVASSSGAGLQSAASGLSQQAREVSSLSSAMSSLAIKVAAVVAAYVSLREVAGFVWDSIMSAARYQTLGVVIEKVGENAGYTAKEMHEFDASVQQTGISMVNSRESLAKMATAQLDLAKASELARVAQNTATVTGQNSSEVFAKLVQGITTGQTVLLHHQGIMIDLNDVYKKYADQIGVSKDALSESEKRTAALNATIEYGERYASAYGAAMETAGKQVTSFVRYISDLKVVIGDAFLESFTGTVFNASDALSQLKEVMKTPEARAEMDALAVSVSRLINTIVSGIPGAVRQVVNLATAMLNLRQSIPENFGWLGQKAIDAIDYYNKSSLENKMETVNEWMSKAKTSEEKIGFQNTLNNLLDEYNKLGKVAASAVEKSAPSQEEVARIKSEAEARALANKELIKKNELISNATSIGEKNKSHAPIESQQTDAYKKMQSEQSIISRGWVAAWQAGEWDKVRDLNDAATASLGAYNDKLDQLDRKANRGAKSAASAANAAARYGEQSASYLQQAQDQYAQLQAQLEGDTLGAKLASINKKYDQAESAIRKSMIGAKGATGDAVAALEQLGKNRALETKIAEAEAWKRSMQDAASVLSKIGEMTGDPTAIYAGRMASAQLWQIEQQKRVDAISDPGEKAKQQAELTRAASLEELDARKHAYEGIKAVSNEYWEAERGRIQNHLDAVRESAKSELAYKIYEAQQWDEYSRQVMENQVANAQTYAEMFAAKWALAYGSYKSPYGKQRDSWERDAESMIRLTDGVTDAIAGSFGDAVRSIADGTFSIENFWKGMLSRMADALAQFVTDQVKNWLKSMLQDFSGSFGGLFSSLFGGGASAATSLTSSDIWSVASWGPLGFAHGGAFPGTSLPANSILTSPVFFTMADSGFHAFARGGLGLAGEAGPELIMPAVRMSDGNYGTRVKLDQGKTSDAATAQPVVNVPVKVVTIFDKAMVGDALREPGNVRVIVAEMEREGFRRG